MNNVNNGWLRSLGFGMIWMIGACMSLIAQPHQRERIFQHSSIENGLSQVSVLCMVQDRKGFMWFGTQDGLNRYDGYTIKVYRHDDALSTSISDNYIQALWEDANGTLWVGTSSGGLNKFDRKTERFTAYKRLAIQNPSNEPRLNTFLNSNNVQSLCGDGFGKLWIGTDAGLNILDITSGIITTHNDARLRNANIQALYRDRSGMIWIGTVGAGLYSLNPTSGIVTAFSSNPSDVHTLSDPTVWSVCEDRAGMLWIGTANGLNRLDRTSGLCTRYLMRSEGQTGRTALINSAASSEVRAVLEDSQGQLWVGTFGGGLHIFDRNSETMVSYNYNSFNARSLSSDQVSSLYEDRSGALWIGTWTSGANMIHPALDRFAFYHNDPLNLQSLSKNNARPICEEPSGDEGRINGNSVLWIGTFGGGLNKFDRRSNTFTAYRHTPANPRSLSSDNIRALCLTSDGELWVGTLAGLNLFDRATGNCTIYTNNPSQPYSISHNQIVSIVEDRVNSRFLWVATAGGGLNSFDRKTGKATAFRHKVADASSLSSDNLFDTYQDRSGTLWVATNGGGLNRFNRTNGTFTVYRHDAEDTTSLNHNRVTCILEDAHGHLWIGTQGGGLDEFDRTTNIFRHFTEKDGLANNAIGGILEDAHGNLWVSTLKGISVLDPAKRTVRNYDSEKSLQSSNAYVGSFCKTRDGAMFFGFVNGMAAFHPDSLHNNPYAPPIVLTALKKFNKTIPLDTVLSERSELVLSYKDAFFTIEFAALSFPAADRNRYLYKLEGFDTEWIDAGTKHEASYTNIDPGTYIFHVKAANHDGIWNEQGISLTVVITPPWWKMWWFRGIVICMALGAVLVAHKLRTRVLKRQRRQLEVSVQERTAELQEANTEIQRQLSMLEEQAQEIELTNSELNEANFQLQQSYNNVNVLSRIGRKITSTLDAEDIFRIIYEGVETLMDADVFAIGVYSKDADHLEITMSMEHGERLPTMTFPMSTRNRLSVLCAELREEIIIGDIEQEYKRYLDELPAPITDKSSQSLVYLPLVADERLFGVITVQSFRKHAYGEHQLDILRTLLPYAAAALDNASAYAEIRRQMGILDQQAVEIELTNTELQQKNLLLEQLNREKNEFLGIVAHDLKNPLSGIMMAATLVEKYWTQLTLKDIAERLQSIQRSAGRMKDIITQLLDINAIETGNFNFTLAEFDVVSVVASIIHDYRDRAASKNITLYFDSQREQSHIFADKNATVEILENLISNAVKYSPVGKNIWILATSPLPSLAQRQEELLVVEGVEAGNDEILEPEYRATALTSHLAFPSVRLLVRDEGQGINAEDMKKLFGKFARLTARPTGGEDSTGLGLSIVKRLVEAMNGVVWCESSLDEGLRGATFAVELPAARKE